MLTGCPSLALNNQWVIYMCSQVGLLKTFKKKKKNFPAFHFEIFLAYIKVERMVCPLNFNLNATIINILPY